MKKIVIFLFILITYLCFVTNNSKVLIPDNSIRIRIIANSDKLEDQEKKAVIKNEVNSYLYMKLKNVDNYSDAKNIVKESVNDINDIVKAHESDYEVIYGDNYFPEKEYKGVKYNEGEYESLVITLGKGNGKNFWCVLFPPLCMIDESKLNDVSYGFYVSELLKRIK